MLFKKKYVKCPCCGNEVIKTKYCNYCGNPLADAKPVTIQQKDEPEPLNDEGLTLLVNVCKKRLATLGGNGYEEIVLYLDETTNDYYLHTYRKYEDMISEEHASYIAIKDLADRVFKYIEDNNLSSWKDNKGVGMCGADYILKFKHNDEIIRLDSSKMLDNLKAYSDISQMLYSGISEVNRRNK